MICGTATGTTTNSYADALNWLVSMLANKTILLKNTHGSNGLKYKLLGYGYPSATGIGNTVVAEITLAAGEIALFQYRRQWHQLVLQVIAAVADSQATYQVDSEGEGGH